MSRRWATDVWAARPVDVVVAGSQLPGMTGLDLLAARLSVDTRRPLFLYSASMTPELATAARDHHFGIGPWPSSSQAS